jgi:uncharacterized membrane protein (UPF0127 family)
VAQATASAAPGPTSVVDASDAPATANTADGAHAPESAAPDATSDAAASDPRCIQPTPASPPPGVAPGPAPGCPPDPGRNQSVPIVRVVFPDAGGAAVDAELVSSRQDMERGLMYRTSMPEDHGMLFDMEVREDHPFWMRGTCIPLDMVFVDGDGLIVGIVENAPPLDDTPRDVGCPSVYALEVNAGWTRGHGVKAGQQMTIPAAVQ